MSRTLLREALKVLATDGLVNLETNRGAWVSRITIEDLDEMFPVMGALKPWPASSPANISPKTRSPRSAPCTTKCAACMRMASSKAISS